MVESMKSAALLGPSQGIATGKVEKRELPVTDYDPKNGVRLDHP
jgi:hypothetical protein